MKINLNINNLFGFIIEKKNCLIKFVIFIDKKFFFYINFLFKKCYFFNLINY